MFLKNWHDIRAYVLQRDKFMCGYCLDDESELQVDHIVPRKKGGTDDLSNLVCACRACNLAKGARAPWDWQIQEKLILPPWWTYERYPGRK